MDPVRQVQQCLGRSELIAAVASVRRDGGAEHVLGRSRLRPVSQEERAILESQGNTAQDWSRVRVAEGFDPLRVHLSSFHGDVVLGRFSRPVRISSGTELPAGIYRSTIAHAVVGHDVLIRDVRLIAHYVVGESAVVFDCGAITCEPQTPFGNGVDLTIGVETGGREVAVYSEIDIDVAAAVVRAHGPRLREYQDAVAQYRAQAMSPCGIIERGARILHAPVTRNSYIGAHAQVDGVTLLTDCTLLSNAEEPVQVGSGACLSGSLVQWGCSVDSQGVVQRSVLTEHSHVAGHGKVTQSIIGPNTGIAGGEVVSSLLGPFVGFHHQALLISAIWPEGKGNISYGANVGSNHTSKAPDQECFPGEGAFIGLGVSIKYPTDLSRAPYTIIASGVTTLPQKITLPFSLVMSPTRQAPGISPAYNEIVPAWQLVENMFALKRNEAKFRSRNHARRLAVSCDVFRPQTVDLMRDACRQLRAVAQNRELYTDREIPGCGKNYMSEASRVAAIAAYQFYTRLYALAGLKARLAQVMAPGGRIDPSLVLNTPSSDLLWEHQRLVLVEELGVTDAVAGLGELPQMYQKVAEEVERSKAKDDERGPRIIDDYCEVHVPAAQDALVVRVWEETRRSVNEVNRLIEALGAARCREN